MGPASLTVEVTYSPRAGEVSRIEVTVAEGSTVQAAISQSRVLQAFPQIDLAQARVGVWGKLKALDATLRDRDRVEIYRPLQVDPKEARRVRYRAHREKTKTR